ncbi:hypothetical protein BS78_01G446100 [Paspalum vaginatum]|nr:hypothetical protein BS78_01G446100 [Paspalum vaginatum]
MDEELAMAAAAAASSECSSGCQSGWTTYLDDHSSSYSYSYSCGTGTARFLHGSKPQPYHHYHGDYSEEDDLSMISDASSGPRHQSSAGNDAEGRGARREEPASAARRRSSSSKRAAAASLLEDTASSPAAFFGYSKAAAAVHVASTPNLQAVGLGERANGYGGGAADAEMTTEIGNAADFSSYAFSATTTGFKAPLGVGGTAWGGGYMQTHYSPAPVANPMATRQASSEKKRW